MRTIVLTNSVGTRRVSQKGQYPIFPELIGGTICFDSLITGTLWRMKGMHIEKDDLIIFNMGINDCIYRKNKGRQLLVFDEMLKEANDNGDPLTTKIINEKIVYVNNKDNNDLFQLLTFTEFETYIDFAFRQVNKGIVLSVVWFNPDSEKIGYAYNEMIQINQILERKANQYGLIYIDLFKPPLLTFDGVHLTEDGHSIVARKIRQVIAKYFRKV